MLTQFPFASTNISHFDLAYANANKFANNAREISTVKKDNTYPEVYVDYDPIAFKNVDITLTLRTRATVDKDANSKATSWRHLTKHRLVTSKIIGYQTTNGEKTEKPFPFILTTTCAPNAMGGSPKDEEIFFSADTELTLYQEMMRLTYQRCFYAQLEQGTQVLIIPAVGLGLYLKKLSPTLKEKAVEANYRALRDAIESISDKKQLLEIICVMADFKGSNRNYTFAESILKDYDQRIHVELAKADALEIAYKLSKQQYSVGLINAGSDRTIGGGYTTINHHKLPAFEETIFQATNARDNQPIDTQNGSKYIYREFPPHLCCDPDSPFLGNLNKPSLNAVNQLVELMQDLPALSTHSSSFFKNVASDNNQNQLIRQELKVITNFPYEVMDNKFIVHVPVDEWHRAFAKAENDDELWNYLVSPYETNLDLENHQLLTFNTSAAAMDFINQLKAKNIGYIDFSQTGEEGDIFVDMQQKDFNKMVNDLEKTAAVDQNDRRPSPR